MSPTCANRSSPFQQQLEAVGLVVESSAVQSTVPISSLGVQVTAREVWSGRREGDRQVRGQCQGKKRQERGGGAWEKSKASGRDLDRQAGRLSPILNDEIHQGQGGLVGDSDSQVQGELSRCLNTHPHLSFPQFTCPQLDTAVP